MTTDTLNDALRNLASALVPVLHSLNTLIMRLNEPQMPATNGHDKTATNGHDTYQPASALATFKTPPKASLCTPEIAALATELETLSIDKVRDAVTAFSKTHGMTAVLAILNDYGAKKVSEVDPGDYSAMLARIAIESLPKKPLPHETPVKVEKAVAKAEVAAVTLEQLQATAKELITLDRPTYLALAAKLGRPSEMKPDTYSTARNFYLDAIHTISMGGDPICL